MDELKTGLFEGRAACEEALRTVLLAGCAQGCRSIHGVAESFVDWPLSNSSVLEALTAWARRGRTLQLMGLCFEDLRQRHPRFVQWRTTFDHCFEAREYELQGGDSQALRAALFVIGGVGPLSFRLIDDVHWRGILSTDARESLVLQEWFDALAQRASPSFPASTLGL